MTLVDSNVLIDLLTNDPVWTSWSAQALDRAALAGPLVINDIVFAELCVRYDQIERVEEAVALARVAILPIPRPALFLASKAFLQYRRSGGGRTGVLPDFFIGAHAAVADLPLLTRDAGRYRTYFPTVRLVTPDVN